LFCDQAASNLFTKSTCRKIEMFRRG